MVHSINELKKYVSYLLDQNPNAEREEDDQVKDDEEVKDSLHSSFMSILHPNYKKKKENLSEIQENDEEENGENDEEENGNNDEEENGEESEEEKVHISNDQEQI
eukprot:CAMPEP_0205799836 /NCGR_PEP_ID=MMETSP0205-20121125/1282_1 /ASSEMBLY_ACC=CAM_ASM_000278 /TAXON_ID=36767 /ORGANISM="Euplotes focardii, Strain TN1" /LENGTH=104 /DNA_ID=CAMNT_0053061897 /DNA_START=657 /DNA_END=971 /DNA_ORIENTATION=+